MALSSGFSSSVHFVTWHKAQSGGPPRDRVAMVAMARRERLVADVAQLPRPASRTLGRNKQGLSQRVITFPLFLVDFEASRQSELWLRNIINVAPWNMTSEFAFQVGTPITKWIFNERPCFHDWTAKKRKEWCRRGAIATVCLQNACSHSARFELAINACFQSTLCRV